MNEFSQLERAVTEALAAQAPFDCDALRAQLATANVTEREFTGFGFFTTFEVAESAPVARLTSSPFGQIRCFVGPGGYELQFMLYLKDGFAEMIEAYSYGDGYGDLDLLKAAFTPPEAFEFDNEPRPPLTQ